MNDMVNYDLSRMKETAGQIQLLLDEIRRELADAEADTRQQQDLHAQILELEKICRGYEILAYSLTAAANIYGSAEAEAAEMGRGYPGKGWI